MCASHAIRLRLMTLMIMPQLPSILQCLQVLLHTLNAVYESFLAFLFIAFSHDTPCSRYKTPLPRRGRGAYTSLTNVYLHVRHLDVFAVLVVDHELDAVLHRERAMMSTNVQLTEVGPLQHSHDGLDVRWDRLFRHRLYKLAHPTTPPSHVIAR